MSFGSAGGGSIEFGRQAARVVHAVVPDVPGGYAE